MSFTVARLEPSRKESTKLCSLICFQTLTTVPRSSWDANKTTSWTGVRFPVCFLSSLHTDSQWFVESCLLSGSKLCRQGPGVLKSDILSIQQCLCIKEISKSLAIMKVYLASFQELNMEAKYRLIDSNSIFWLKTLLQALFVKKCSLLQKRPET